MINTDDFSKDEINLRKRIDDFDRAFLEENIEELIEFFAQDACLLWPAIPDIVGREAIQHAFEEFASVFDNLVWEPMRQVVEIHPTRAYTLGSFIEIRRPWNGGSRTKIYGRMVEFWEVDADGKWRVKWLMTSRYGEDEQLD